MWLVWTAIALVLIGLYCSWTAGRLDRLHARVDAAWAALDAQLVRRAFAAQALLPLLPPGPEHDRLAAAVNVAAEAGEDGRQGVENDLSRALREARPLLAAGSPGLAELDHAAERVLLARSFHNSAVRDTRRVRARKVPRALRLSGHRALPAFFDVDDTALS